MRAEHQVGVITCTAGLCGGDPVLAGTRIPAAAIARSAEQARNYWPHAELTDADIAACVACVAWWAGSQEATLYAIERLLESGPRTTPLEIQVVLSAIKRLVLGVAP